MTENKLLDENKSFLQTSNKVIKIVKYLTLLGMTMIYITSLVMVLGPTLTGFEYISLFLIFTLPLSTYFTSLYLKNKNTKWSKIIFKTSLVLYGLFIVTVLLALIEGGNEWEPMTLLYQLFVVLMYLSYLLNKLFESLITVVLHLIDEKTLNRQ